MKFCFFFLISLLSLNARSDAVIFSGANVKALKQNLNLFDSVYVLSGSVDPSSSATSAPKGSLYLNNSNGSTYQKADAGSSTNWTALSAGGFSNTSLRYYDVPVGLTNGATNTTVAIFTTAGSENTGSDVTYATSVLLGDTFTINATGIYATTFSGQNATASSVCITKNGTNLSTSCTAITIAQILCLGGANAGGNSNSCAWTGLLSSTDIIRAQSTRGDDVSHFFTITRVH